MKKLIQNRVVAFAIAAGVLSILNLQPSTASAQNTAFYFQDQVDQDSPTDLANGTHKIGNGNYTFVFRLATAASGNNYIGDSVTNDKIVIDHKQFSTPLDFGNVFDGSPRWVEIAQKKGKDFVTLTPRQLLPSTPYALYAYATSNLLGTLTLSNLPFAFLTNNAPSVTFGALDVADGKITYGGYTLMLATNSNYFAGLDAGNLTLTGAANTGVGAGALTSDAAGSDNTAFGVSTLYFNNSGSNNAAYGFNSLLNNTSGNNNIALGALAGFSVISNDNIDIGNQGTTNDSGIIRIGDPAIHTDTYLAGVIHGDGSGLTNLNIILPANVVTTNEPTVTLNNLDVGGTLDLASGQITSGGNSILYSDNNYNFFTGLNAGNSTNNTGDFNIANGGYALEENTSGFFNIANGGYALQENTNGFFNTANGGYVLQYNTSGFFNTADGGYALQENTSGFFNTADGAYALDENNGNYNIALGAYAGGSLISGSYNIDIGNTGTGGDNGIIRIGDPANQTDTYLAGVIHGDGSGLTNLVLPGNVVTTNESSVTLNALTLQGLVTANNGINVVGGNLDLSSPEITSGGNSIFYSDGNGNFFAGIGAGNVGNDDGIQNTANGYHALYSNTTGNYNTANGFEALQVITTGYYNVANGSYALWSNTNGIENTANGYGALGYNQNGSGNTADGFAALINVSGSENTADGSSAFYNLTNGNGNIALGFEAGYNITTGNNNIDIGNGGVDGDNGIIRIGDTNNQTDTYLAGNVWASGNVTAYSVNVTSDRNAKEDFSTVNPQQVLAKVAAMPVTEWNYKTAKNVEHIGPMAQDFQAAFGLNGKDDKHISVVDEGGVALAAIQGLNQKMNEKDTEIQNLKQQNDSFEKQLNELKALVSQLSQQQTK